MTTIAYTKGELAFDSLVTDSSGERSGSVIKGSRLPDGTLVAFAGNLSHCQLFHKWAVTGCINNDIKRTLDGLKDPCYTGIVVSPKGIITQYDDCTLPIEFKNKMYSWGSGAAFAMGAMVYGASAKEAVQVAKIIDICTGGRIRVLKLKE